MNPQDAGILVPVGKALLIGAFSWSLISALRAQEELDRPFETLVVGLLALLFYRQGAAILSELSSLLQVYLEQRGGGVSVADRLATALQSAGHDPKALSENTLAQSPLIVLKSGVWGVLISISQFAFLCVEALLKLSQRVLWELLLVLFPLAAGVYPLAPSMAQALALYAVELSLWLPILCLINLVAGRVISSSEITTSFMGLGVVVIELLMIALIIHVPLVTHRFMSGAFSQALGVGEAAYSYGKRGGTWTWGAVNTVRDWRSGGTVANASTPAKSESTSGGLA